MIDWVALSHHAKDLRVVTVGEPMKDAFHTCSIKSAVNDHFGARYQLESSYYTHGGAGNVAMHFLMWGSKSTTLATASDLEGDIPRRERYVLKSLIDAQVRLGSTESKGEYWRVDTDLPESTWLTCLSEESIADRLTPCDIIVIADYGKGLLRNHKVMWWIKNTLAISPKCLLAVTPKTKEPLTSLVTSYPHVITNVNLGEMNLFDMNCISHANIKACLATRGNDPISLLMDGTCLNMQPWFVEYQERTEHTVRDPNGAGDTALATFALLYHAAMSGHVLSPVDILEGVNAACAYTVSQYGTVTPAFADMKMFYDLGKP